MEAHPSRPFPSRAGMLVNPNDAFCGLDSLELPRRGQLVTYVPAFDAGSEANSESCRFIPGPACNGQGAGVHDPSTPERYVHVSHGIQGVGELAPETFDWRNPVAAVTVVRTR